MHLREVFVQRGLLLGLFARAGSRGIICFTGAPSLSTSPLILAAAGKARALGLEGTRFAALRLPAMSMDNAFEGAAAADGRLTTAWGAVVGTAALLACAAPALSTSCGACSKLRAVTPAAETEFSLHTSADDRLVSLCAVRSLLPVTTMLLVSRPLVERGPRRFLPLPLPTTSSPAGPLIAREVARCWWAWL